MSVYILFPFTTHSAPPLACKGEHISKGREEWATKFLQDAPSQNGKPETFASDQKKAMPAFRFHRPPLADATIPITLYNPIFGQFQDDCKTYRPTKEDRDFVFNLSISMSNFYEDDSDMETGMAERARDDFGEYGLKFLVDEIDGYTTGGALRWNDFCLAFLRCLWMTPSLSLKLLGPTRPLREISCTLISILTFLVLFCTPLVSAQVYFDTCTTS